jgi:hypothetical protein
MLVGTPSEYEGHTQSFGHLASPTLTLAPHYAEKEADTRKEWAAQFSTVSDQPVASEKVGELRADG